MIEFIFLFIVVRNIGRRARDKGRSALGYRVLTVVTWFMGEFTGAVVGQLVFGDAIGWLAVAFVGGLIGMFVPVFILGKHGRVPAAQVEASRVFD